MPYTVRLISRSRLLLSLLALLACGGAAVAQGPTYKLGRTPTEAEVHAWNHAVGPEGKELPDGSGTAVEGAKIYAAKCAYCHGQNAEGKFPFPRLAGGVGTLTNPTPVKSSGSYLPYATTIWDFIDRAMPRDAEGTLRPDEIYAVTAFILFKSEIVKETDVLDKRTLVEVRMPNRDGFFPDPPQSKPDSERGWLPYWKPGSSAKPEKAEARQ